MATAKELRGRTAVVLTVSDRCFAGKQADVSGPTVAKLLVETGAKVVAAVTVPDELAEIVAALRRAAASAELIVTTGGTGLAARDVTPEATRAVCDRLLDGFAELMRAEGRKQTQFAPLSRALSGTLGRSLIVNVPGSPRGAESSLEAVLPLIPHALGLLDGSQTVHDEHQDAAV